MYLCYAVVYSVLICSFSFFVILFSWYACACPAEFETLSRLEISDGAKFLQRNMSSETERPLMLTTVAVGPSLVSQIDAAVEDAITSNSWVDVAVCDGNKCYILVHLFTLSDHSRQRHCRNACSQLLVSAPL